MESGTQSAACVQSTKDRRGVIHTHVLQSTTYTTYNAFHADSANPDLIRIANHD